MRLEDAILVFIYKGHYQNGQLAAKVASSRRIVGEVRSAPAHPSLALSMHGVIEIASSRRSWRVFKLFPYLELTQKL